MTSHRKNLLLTIKRLQRLRRAFKLEQKTKDGSYLKVNGIRILFDIGSWAAKAPIFETNDYGVEKKVLKAAPRNYCGTACCVAGTAGMIPEFRRAGLKTVITDEYSGNVRYKNESGEYAFADFFKLSINEANDVCMPNNYGCDLDHEVTPEMVIEKLDGLIQDRKLRLKHLKHLKTTTDINVLMNLYCSAEEQLEIIRDRA